MSKNKFHWDKWNRSERLWRAPPGNEVFTCMGCELDVPVHTIQIEWDHELYLCRACMEKYKRKKRDMISSTPTANEQLAKRIVEDANLIFELFKHNKNSTLEFGWIRGRVIKDDRRFGNDRVNAALDYLERKNFIDKVAHGRWRYIKPSEPAKPTEPARPSATVVASAPITEAEAETVMPKFSGAMTDLVYSALREHQKKNPQTRGMTVRELVDTLGVSNDRAAVNNCAASVNSLERMGWISTDRINRPFRSRALTVNALGRSADSPMRHSRAPELPAAFVKQAEAVTVQAAQLTPSPAQLSPNGQAPKTFTLEQVKAYGELQARRELLRADIKRIVEPIYAQLAEVEAELAKYE